MLVRCSGGDMALSDLTCRAAAARRRKGGSGGPSGDMACPGTGVWVPTSGGQLGWYAPHVVGSKPVFSIFLSGSSSVIAPRRIPSARFPAGPGSWLPSCASPRLVWACRATLAPSTLGAHPPCVSCCWIAAIPTGQGAAEPLGRVRADGASEPRTVGDACVDVPNTRFYSPVPLLACPHRPPIPHFFQVAVLPASNCPLLTFVGGHTAAALRSRSSTKTSPGERPSQETHPRKKSTPETRGATSTVTSRLHSTERADQNHTTARRQTKPHQQTPPPHRTTRARTHARTPRKSHAPTLLPARLHRPASRGSLLHHTTAVARRVDESISLSPSLAASGEASFLHRGQGGAMNSTTGRAGVIRARDDAGNMDKLAHAILDDVLYNVLSDLVMKTHREEKTARANTAAIRVEKLASDASDTSVPDAKPDVRVETDAAIYEDGKVLLKGNPLQTTQDILCPKCHLPRLLYPTDGKGARKPDPTVIYCKKHPYIDKPGCDIYGQSWVAPGPGRGKKKKDMEKKDGTDSPATPEQRPPNVLSFPSATCSKCKRCILVTRLNNHMGSCIGNSGRNASRAAAQKLNNGGSQHDSTPPSSQKATPAPGSRASSPRKRDASDDDGADSDNSHKKKKLKPSASMTKKVIIKSKPMLKKEKSKGASQLSQEQKLDDSDTPHLTPRKGTPKMAHKDGSPLKKVKAAKPMTSSPVSKNGREPDGESESSGTLSSPPGK
ncbi:hypothetical protein Purlil1_13071 [Purpureocillium lilacinum]|uniref:Transcriptional activator n=1 Tax=Purpureocillium lilacinum TaxID=33203 RepID=A0ABR0BFA9_PURLI|nr:hypothetical protein Purlil1_13071 [Purpureocillium lilacinum]